MLINCLKCKGKDPQKFCGRKFCPISVKQKAHFEVKKQLNKADFSSSSPGIFVGRHGCGNHTRAEARRAYCL